MSGSYPENRRPEAEIHRFQSYRIVILVAMIVLSIAAIAFSVVMDTRTNRFDYYWFLIPLIAVFWIGGYFLIYSYTSRLKKLANQAARFSSGDYTVKFDIDGPADIQRIANSLNDMSETINVALENLKSEEQRQIQFVSDVSHEIRTPLTAIRGAAETLLDGGMSQEDQERFLTTIGSEAERLTRLANDLLTLQRIEGATGELPTHRLDLRLIAQAVKNTLEPLLEEREVELTIAGEAPPILGDDDRIYQVFSNLIDNASRVVGAGGHVRVELTGMENKAVIAVIDDGPGLDDETAMRLFDRFYRADPSRTRARGGTGLGLAIVKAIVRAHGGNVQAKNLPGGGACFIVELPALPEAPEKRDPFEASM